MEVTSFGKLFNYAETRLQFNSIDYRIVSIALFKFTLAVNSIKVLCFLREGSSKASYVFFLKNIFIPFEIAFFQQCVYDT